MSYGMINQCLPIRIPQLKAKLGTGLYLNHGVVEQEKKINQYKHCRSVYYKMINLSQTITIHQRKRKASLLTGLYLDHNSAEQRKQIIIRCTAPHEL